MHTIKVNLDRRLFLMGMLLSLGAVHSLNTYADSLDKLIIVLKLDDFVGNSPNGLSDKWIETIEFLKRNNIAASFGVIGNKLNDKNSKFLNQLSEISRNTLFEVWNHGYSGSKRKGDFLDTEEEQFIKLSEIQTKLEKLTGRVPSFFGPHSSNFNDYTFSALNRIDDIKGVWFYKPPIELTQRFYVIPRSVEAEKPIFHPNLQTTLNGINTQKINALQFHPDQWDKDRFEIFCKTVLALVKEGANFVLPSSFLKGQK